MSFIDILQPALVGAVASALVYGGFSIYTMKANNKFSLKVKHDERMHALKTERYFEFYNFLINYSDYFRKFFDVVQQNKHEFDMYSNIHMDFENFHQTLEKIKRLDNEAEKRDELAKNDKKKEELKNRLSTVNNAVNTIKLNVNESKEFSKKFKDYHYLQLLMSPDLSERYLQLEKSHLSIQDSMIKITTKIMENDYDYNMELTELKANFDLLSKAIINLKDVMKNELALSS